MKKIIALLLALMMVLSLMACGAKEEITEETTEEVVEETTEETDEEDIAIFDEDFSVSLPILTPDGEFIEVEDLPTEEELNQASTETLTALENIWALYGEDEKFAIMGGNPEAGVMDAPGNYDMAYVENLGFNLVIPAEQLTNVTEAATMIHMMNANTFTCGAVKLAEGVDAAAFASAVRDALQGNQWICGFPETMIIADLGAGMVLISFGVNDAMTPFAAHLAEAYADAQILYNEAIAG